MMKLILSLTLIWTLSSTAEALQCWKNVINETELHPCNSPGLCATMAYQVFESTPNKGRLNTQFIRKWCLPSEHPGEGNHTFSLTIGILTVSAFAHVCNTDGCNNQTIPFSDPGIQKKNGLQCLNCDHPHYPTCTKTLQCVGVEDRCISGTAADERNKNETLHAFGCVSANLCEDAHLLESFLRVKFFRKPKCCERDLCNSAWSVKLNVMSLLMGLFTLALY